MNRQFELTSIQVANLRGFRDATLPLRDGLTLLVGPNNSGKTSILRLLDWVLNQATDETLTGEARLTEEELRLLLPARETRNAARRLVLAVRVFDGRRQRRFSCRGDIAQLRVGLTLPGNVRVNVGAPRRNEVSDPNALELLHELRRGLEFSLVPASRDARSASFRAAFREAVLAKLEERAVHAGRAGAPGEYRKIKAALDQIRTVADALVSPVWDDLQGALPPGMATSAAVTSDVTPTDLISWIADRTSLWISTGDHDRSTVQPDEVGSGLQSLLELALQQSRPEIPDVERIIAVEEPEAYLHPSAQRALARIISRATAGKRLVSTHSPILVDETRFGETVLVRDHCFFAPADVEDEVRAEINTALLVGHGAEMAFAHSVLLVEGDGDRAYYETLRRRMARVSADGRLDQLAVVPVGSKSAFAPWLRMLTAYGSDGDRPIRWLVIADGDAATQVRQAHRDAGIRLSAPLRRALLDAANERANPDASVFTAATDRVNKIARAADVGLHLSPIDLEHALLLRFTDAAATTMAYALNLTATTRQALETQLRGRKAAYVRAAFAEAVDESCVSSDTRIVLRRWLAHVMSPNAAAKIVKSCI